MSKATQQYLIVVVSTCSPFIADMEPRHAEVVSVSASQQYCITIGSLKSGHGGGMGKSGSNKKIAFRQISCCS